MVAKATAPAALALRVKAIVHAAQPCPTPSGAASLVTGVIARFGARRRRSHILSDAAVATTIPAAQQRPSRLKLGIWV
jgi:hypothetical protein